MKTLFTASMMTLGLILGAASTQAAELVEIRLVDNIDDERGYCVDIAGGRGADAPLDKGLQAHNCYDYAGSLLEDQSFDVDLLKQGQAKITYFNVCMTATSLTAGSALELASCNNSNNQSFSLEANGHLITTAKPELCVTVSATEKREGRGGSPAHVMRPISLELCSPAASSYQIWKTYSL